MTKKTNNNVEPQRYMVTVLVSEELSADLTAADIYKQISNTFDERVAKLEKKYGKENITVERKVVTVNKSYETVREYIYDGELFTEVKKED